LKKGRAASGPALFIPDRKSAYLDIITGKKAACR
jgi:hypothetical protein